MTAVVAEPIDDLAIGEFGAVTTDSPEPMDEMRRAGGIWLGDGPTNWGRLKSMVGLTSMVGLGLLVATDVDGSSAGG